ncbi:MAG: DUF481 domain-containing protein [Planctomycetota bacterium]|jgi:hypothetical protein
MRGLALASLAIAGALPALAEERPGRVVIDGAEHDVIDIFVEDGRLRYRKAGKKTQEAALSEVDSFTAPYEMRLRTKAGDTITVSRVEYEGEQFRLAAPRLGEFVYLEEEVQSIAFEGAEALYADLERIYYFEAGVHIEDAPLSGEFYFSYLQAKADDNDQTILLRFNMSRVSRNWRQTLRGKQLLAFEDGNRDTDVRELIYKSERFVTSRWSAYIRGSLGSDADADIDFRGGADLGVGRQLLVSESQELLAEASYAFLHERSGSLQEDDSFLGLNLSYEARVTKTRTFSEKVRLQMNGSRTRFRSATSLVLGASSSTFFRLGFVVETDDEPLPGTPGTTTSTEVALGWKF